MAQGQWVSESRFGWNRTYLAPTRRIFQRDGSRSYRTCRSLATSGVAVGLHQHQRSLQHAELRSSTISTGAGAQLRSKAQPHVRTGISSRRASAGCARHGQQDDARRTRSSPTRTLADTLANIPQSINAISFGAPRYQSHISMNSAASFRTTGASGRVWCSILASATTTT